MPMNKYEKILSLSIDDMASFLSELQYDSTEPTSQEMYEWLLSRYPDNDNDVLYTSTDGLQKQLSNGNLKEKRC